MRLRLIVFSLAIASLQSVARGQTASITLSDGVAPEEDGQTQADKRVVVTCVYSGTLGRDHTTLTEYSSDGTTWERVVLEGVRQGRWNTDDYDSLKTTGTPETVTLTIKSAREVDQGKYRCILYSGYPNNPAIVSEASKELTIFSPTESVSIEDTPGTLRATAGEETTVACRAVNGSKPTMKLTVGTEVVADNMRVEEDSPGIYRAEARVTFRDDQDGAQITCSALVATFSEPVTGSATLQIYAKPSVSCTPKTQAVATGGEAKITCVISGKPLPAANEITWFSGAGHEKGSFPSDHKNEQSGYESVVSDTNDGKRQVVLKVKVMETNTPDTFTLKVSSTGLGVAVSEDTAAVTLAAKEPVKDPNSASRSSPLGLLLLLLVSALLL